FAPALHLLDWKPTTATSAGSDGRTPAGRLDASKSVPSRADLPLSRHLPATTGHCPPSRHLVPGLILPLSPRVGQFGLFGEEFSNGEQQTPDMILCRGLGAS